MKAFLRSDKVFIEGTMEVMGKTVRDEQVIHYNHSIPTTLEEIQDDIWEMFVVYESGGNYPILHGVCAENEDCALQEVAGTLDMNEEGEYELIGVQKLEF